ncbi:dd730847-c694-4664-a1d3-c4a6475a479f [Thermothielavioides terrestris]|uniref:Dd730847-c694-4664-a1d3-c4a6475a479f n=1 Tax=Thermothielavioides terrestris TaxID=2587410 RepID=A0A3S4F630_9PEZI|nr:dd730847-c694-4664-a1d3-c4a6475a479f [Thermothielavioides terrestris]
MAITKETAEPATPELSGLDEPEKLTHSAHSSTTGQVEPASAAAPTDQTPRSPDGNDVKGGTTAGSPQSNQPQHLTGVKLVVIVASVTMAVFLMLLDTSIVGTATPYITDEFHALQDIGWYAAAYQVASAPLQLLTGKIYQKFPLKWTFLGFFALFELGSVLCGAAQSSTMLVVGRAVAGMGSSGLFNGAMVILVASVPLHRRPPIMGMFMGISQLGVVCGPLIGGALTEYVSWRWCFYINLPVGGAFALFLMILHVPEQAPKPSFVSALPTLFRDLDLIGFSLMSPAAIMLLLALEYGSGTYPWNSSVVIGLFCGAGATCIVWLVWNWRRGDKALVPVSMARRRVVWSGAITQALMLAPMFMISYFLPIYFQAVKGVSPSKSGVYVLPNIMGQLLTAFLSGFMVQRTGYILPYVMFACATTAVGTGLLALLSPSTPTGEWVGFQLISGLGRGFGLQMCLLAVQTVLKPAEVPLAISLLMFTQFLTSSVFLVVGNAIFDVVLRAQLAAQAPAVDAQAVIDAGTTGFRAGVVGPADLAGVVLAYANSCKPVFALAAAAPAAAFFVAPFLGMVDVRKGKKAAPPKGDEKA